MHQSGDEETKCIRDDIRACNMTLNFDPPEVELKRIFSVQEGIGSFRDPKELNVPCA